MIFLRQAAVLLAVFAAVTAVAALVGSAGLGPALALGQIGFVVALAYVLLRR